MNGELEKRADKLAAEIEQANRQKDYDSFDNLYELVEDGAITPNQLKAIQLQLGPVAVVKAIQEDSDV